MVLRYVVDHGPVVEMFNLAEQSQGATSDATQLVGFPLAVGLPSERMTMTHSEYDLLIAKLTAAGNVPTPMSS